MNIPLIATLLGLSLIVCPLLYIYVGPALDDLQLSTLKTLGIIVTYRHQIAAIREALPDISIDTVERYQGSQRDVIIYDVGVSRQYQLDFLTASTFTDDKGQVVDRKLNVALTRARKQMIIVGCSSILRQNTLYRQLIDNFSV